MRVAAVAFVLVVGAAVVLAFANTLNSWVLGGLLGGLAAILLSIPISLMLFTLLARRHDAREHFARRPFEVEPDFAEEGYGAPVVYEAEGYLLPQDEDFSADPRVSYLPDNRRLPVSGYLALPPAEHDQLAYEDELEPSGRQEPRNYPRQPRFAARSLAHDDEIKSPSRSASSRRHPSTRSLALHQSAALRMARQEAQQQRAHKRDETGSRGRRTQGEHLPLSHRPNTSRSLRPQTSASRRPADDYETGSLQQNAQPSWEEEEDFSGDFSTEQLRERYQQYPRRPGYPRQPRSARRFPTIDPWTGSFEEEDDEEESLARRSRRDPDRMYGNLRNPLVRRAPYLYEDDPLREEFAQQLENDRPITRRSSLYERYADEE